MSTEAFAAHRSVLVGVAYRILGSVSDAEDVVQEAWLRWSGAAAGSVADPKAYLITVTTRLSIDRLRRLKARRESYVGCWLPEPVSTEADGAAHVELAESVELALLVVLETLSPLERAVFVLREAFGMSFAEIAEAVGREEAAARQLARRARAHVAERRPRFDVDRGARRELTERFLTACRDGDLAGLADLLAADVRLVSDGGGRAKAPLRVVVGADKVSRFLTAIATDRGAGAYLKALGHDPAAPVGSAVTEVNGGPGIVVSVDGRPLTVFSLVVADGRVAEIYLVANPDKLGGMSRTGWPGASAGV